MDDGRPTQKEIDAAKKEYKMLRAKNTPMLPLLGSNGHFVCRNCHKSYADRGPKYRPNYCENCGQKVEWRSDI